MKHYLLSSHQHKVFHLVLVWLKFQQLFRISSEMSSLGLFLDLFKLVQ